MLIKDYFIEDVAVVEETEEVPRCLPKETICFKNLAGVLKKKMFTTGRRLKRAHMFQQDSLTAAIALLSVLYKLW